MKFYRITALWSLVLAGVFPLRAEEKPTAEEAAFFETEIRPALSKYCYECHSEEAGKTRGGLLLDTKAGLAQGGDTGPPIVPGNPEASLFWDAIAWLDPDMEMPPKEKMPPEVLENFRRWIAMGAPDPRVDAKFLVESSVDLEAGRKHWAFQAPRQAAAPAVSNSQWSRDEMDRFILARLEEADLEPAPDANPAILLRRLSFDLTGLPPKPAELSAFVKSWSRDPEAALEEKVDELLKRPQFGERWGRFWLDVARYAESTGKDVNFTYPNAWRYRNYVIDSFNADKPYDEFVREQIAGDLLPTPSDEDWQENLIATGFLALGTKGLNEPNPRQFQMDVVDEQIDAVSKAILGLTVSCARCHDHKSDPIPTTDYYALAGIFKSTNTYYGTFRVAQNKRPSTLLELPIPDPVASMSADSYEDVAALRKELESLRQRGADLRRQRTAGESTNQNAARRIRSQISLITEKLDAVNPDGSPKSLAMGVQDADSPANAQVLVRGDPEKPAQEVERGFLQVLDFAGTVSIKEGRSGRRELANWLTAEENPLTARVMVNRVWQHLFGEGLVSTPNNWGLTGQAPSHPLLLDHLALRFMESDWSVKSLLKEILLSRTYRMSSAFSEANFAVDPDNRLRWRSTPRQLDAESLRDAMLLAAGELDLKRPSGSVVASFDGARAGRRVDPGSSDAGTYRSVYLPMVRDMLPEALALFDFPDTSLPSEKRSESNMPSQSLYLMNNPFVMARAESMAAMLATRFESWEERLRGAFVLAYARPASAVEVEGCLQGIQRFRSLASQTNSNRAEIDRLALETFCQTLLASAEFRILD